VRVDWNGAESWEIKSVLADKLTMGTIGISVFTSLRSGFTIGFIEDVVLVNIFWALLDSIEWLVIKESTSLPHGSNEGRANHGFSIMIFSSVLPAIFLNHSHDAGHIHAFFGGFGGNTADAEATCAKLLVQGLSEEGVSEIFVEFLDDGKGNWDKVLGEELREV